MKEFVVHALVLGCVPKGGDRVADLFTLELGRVEARMVAGRAIVSKFAPHCDPLNLLAVRLVKKNRYTLADVVARNRFPSLRASPKALASALKAFFLLRTMMPKEEPDPRLFHEVSRALARSSLTVRTILALLGYDSTVARCARCGKSSVHAFVPEEGLFFCRACFARAHNEVILDVDYGIGRS